MARFSLRRLFTLQRPRAYRASFPTRALDRGSLTWPELLKLRLPRLVLDVACILCIFALTTILALNLTPQNARRLGIGKISSWRLLYTPSSSPSHHQRSEYIYTLYPAGICVQPISSPPTALLSGSLLSGLSIRGVLTASAQHEPHFSKRAIDHDSRHIVSSAACITPIKFNSTSATSMWRFHVPQPYSIDDYAPTEAILKQRPFGMVGPVDTYPAFVCYVIAVIFEIVPLLFLLRSRRVQQWQQQFGRSLRHRSDDYFVGDFEYDDAELDESTEDGAEGTLLSHKPQLNSEPHLHAFTTICALVAMAAAILASVHLTLLRDTLAWSLERGAADVQGVWKEDIGLGFTWAATACLILVDTGLLLRLLVLLVVRQGLLPRQLLTWL